MDGGLASQHKSKEVECNATGTVHTVPNRSMARVQYVKLHMYSFDRHHLFQPKSYVPALPKRGAVPVCLAAALRQQQQQEEPRHSMRVSRTRVSPTWVPSSNRLMFFCIPSLTPSAALGHTRWTNWGTELPHFFFFALQ